jgi:hypothetical protein
MDWWIDGLMDWWIDGLMDWWIDGLMDWWIDGLIYLTPAISEFICDVCSMTDVFTADALLHPNEPLGTFVFRNSMPYRLLARHSSHFFLLSFNGSNDLRTHQKIEPGASSVAESEGQDFWHFLFTAALDILAGS